MGILDSNAGAIDKVSPSTLMFSLILITGVGAKCKLEMPSFYYLRVSLLVGFVRTADLRHVFLVIELASTAHRGLHAGKLVLHLLDQVLLLIHVTKFSVGLTCSYNLVEVILFGTPFAKHLLTRRIQ